MSRTLDPSFQRFFSLFRKKDHQHDSRKLTLTLENLEDRVMLSGSGFDSAFGTLSDLANSNTGSNDAVYSNHATLPDAEVSAENQVVITSITVNVNGESIKISNNFDTLRLNAGDELQVTGVSYLVHDSINAEGVFSAEGYLNKLNDEPAMSSTDYSDGRFTNREFNQAVVAGDSMMTGLDGGWTVEEGTDRLSVALIHYFGDEFEHKTTFGVRLQVGEPDFVVDPSVVDQFVDGIAIPGQEFSVKGIWLNQGDGTYYNYSEVDVFNASTGEVEWSGVTFGNANVGSPVVGEYLNTNPNDAFSERWTPTANSEYIIKFFADPEDTWQETNEENNVVVISFAVGGDNSGDLVANGDSFSGSINRDFQKLDVLANDDGENLKISEYSQGEHGKVRKRKDGTLRYKAEKGFVGADEFTYTVTDSEGNSDIATVEVNVLGKGISAGNAFGHVNEKIKLNVKLDTERFDAVLVSGVNKRGMELTVGEQQKKGQHIVPADQLADLHLVSQESLDNHKIRFIAMKDGKIVKKSKATLKVNVEAVHNVVNRNVVLQDINATVHNDLQQALEKLAKNDNVIFVQAIPDLFEISGVEVIDGLLKITPNNVTGLSLTLKDGADLESALENGLKFEFELTSVDTKSGKSKHISVETGYKMKDAENAVEKFTDSVRVLI